MRVIGAAVRLAGLPVIKQEFSLVVIEQVVLVHARGCTPLRSRTNLLRLNGGEGKSEGETEVETALTARSRERPAGKGKHHDEAADLAPLSSVRDGAKLTCIPPPQKLFTRDAKELAGPLVEVNNALFGTQDVDALNLVNLGVGLLRRLWFPGGDHFVLVSHRSSPGTGAAR
jgi:hypothetical protein